MSKLDEKKEYIGALKVYLGFMVAIILSIGTGLIKLYLANITNSIFWLGIIIIFIFFVIFGLTAKKLHIEITKLRDL